MDNLCPPFVILLLVQRGGWPAMLWLQCEPSLRVEIEASSRGRWGLAGRHWGQVEPGRCHRYEGQRLDKMPAEESHSTAGERGVGAPGGL